MKKIHFIIILIFIAFFLFLSFNAEASIFGNALKNTASGTDYGEPASVPQYIAGIVKVLLTLIGIVFVALIIYGGFLYMTAMGESDKVKKGKNVIIASVIGLIIILSGYSIAYFVALQLEQPGAGIPGPNGNYEDPGNPDYGSLNACEYRFRRYGNVSAACCTQSDFCKAHQNECLPGGGSCP
jgi:hypothetical protein